MHTALAIHVYVVTDPPLVAPPRLLLGPAVVRMISEGFANLDSVGRAALCVCWRSGGSLKCLLMTADHLLGGARKSSVSNRRHGGEIEVNNHRSNNELMWLCTGWKRIGVACVYVCDVIIYIYIYVPIQHTE